MAPKDSRSDLFSVVSDFEHAFETLFDDLLISRWRGARRAAHDTPQVIDQGDRFEVRMTAPGGDARALEIEASERRLVVRDTSSSQVRERSVNFTYPIDADAATARIHDGFLTITLPKRRPRKIQVG